MKNNNAAIIKISKEGNDSIIFNFNNKKLIININEFNNNSFDDVFDYIIEKIGESKNIELILDTSQNFSSDSRIDEIINGLKKVIEKEVEEILKDIGRGNSD